MTDSYSVKEVVEIVRDQVNTIRESVEKLTGFMAEISIKQASIEKSMHEPPCPYILRTEEQGHSEISKLEKCVHDLKKTLALLQTTLTSKYGPDNSDLIKAAVTKAIKEDVTIRSMIRTAITTHSNKMYEKRLKLWHLILACLATSIASASLLLAVLSYLK
jgi:t-SNARE complex subunit (syntaxin)